MGGGLVMVFRYGRPEGAEAARLASGVGRLIGEERRARGWSLAELGRRSGVTAGSISGYERGRVRPSWKSLCQLAVAFCPDSRPAAQALALRLAEATGPSLAGPPWMPTGVSRELAVAVLVRSARVLGFDLDDDAVRAAVAEQLRLAVGEAPVTAARTALEALPTPVLAIEGGPDGG